MITYSNEDLRDLSKSINLEKILFENNFIREEALYNSDDICIFKIYDFRSDNIDLDFVVYWYDGYRDLIKLNVSSDGHLQRVMIPSDLIDDYYSLFNHKEDF